METSVTEKKRRDSIGEPPDMSDLNIMMLGSVGVGKSASGNTILGVQAFEEGFSPSSVTNTCQSAQKEIDGQRITVIDTVGLCDGEVKMITDVQSKIKKMIESTDIDVFLLVIKLGQPFTQESGKIVKWILDNFGAKFLKHTIVLFTHGDQLQRPIEDYLRKNEALRSVVDQCSGGVHVFNKRNQSKNRSQVTELLKKINRLRKKNGFSRYTKQDYAAAQRKLLKETCKTAAAMGGGAAGGAGLRAAVGVGTGLGAAAGGLMLSTLGAVAVTATGGAALGAAAVGAGVYFMARKYFFRRNG